MPTTSIDALMEEAMSLPNNQLDKLMKLFKNRDANFCNGFLKALMIVDY